MKSLTAVSAVLPLLLLASGCSKDRNEPRGNGTLNIRLEMDDRIDLVATQACNTKAAPDLGAFTLEVTQDETVVHKIPTLGANTSPSLTLEAGDYTVSAYSQPFAAPAFDTPVYGASQLLTIMAGGTKDVALECTQTNAGVKINYSDDFKAQHTSYSTRIAHSTGTLDFSGSDAGRTGYFPTGYVDLIVTADGKEYTQAIQLKARRLYTITVKDANVPVTSGHANISISVSTDVTNENVEITFPANGGNTGGDGGTRQTIYGENIGSTDVTSSALVLSFKGWQNQTGSGISYSGSGRIDSQSALQSASYSGASGGNYLTLSAGNKFNISGLSTTGYSSPGFTFGLACATTGFDPAQLEVYVNSADAADDGPALSYTYESNGEWMLCTVSTGIPSGDNLRIRIVSQASFRLDDFKLTGEK